MNDIGPSSVTIEEAIAKMIGFEVLPEYTSLHDALDHLVRVTKEDFLNAQEEELGAAIITRFADELAEWEASLSKANHLLEDIEKSIQENDPLLLIAPSDTCKRRLTTQSVYVWAETHHDITIDDWKDFRGPVPSSDYKIDRVALEGSQLFESIVRLTDELLSRNWSAWKGTIPDLSPPKDHHYFIKERPNITAISKDIESKIVGSDAGAEIVRKTSDHIKGATKCLQEPNAEAAREYSKKEQAAAYRTLIGLYRLLRSGATRKSGKERQACDIDSLDIMRFVKNLRVNSGQIREKELIACLTRADHIAREKNW